jgi:hypothetical protein
MYKLCRSLAPLGYFLDGVGLAGLAAEAVSARGLPSFRMGSLKSFDLEAAQGRDLTTRRLLYSLT